MKVRRENGVHIVIDGDHTFTKEDGAVAFGYALLMAHLRPQKVIPPTCYPVRSLVPHPKKRRLTAKQRAFVKAYKARCELLEVF